MQQTPEPKKKSRGGLYGVILAVAFITLISGIVASHSSTSPNPDQATATVSNQIVATINARQTAGALELGQFAAAETAEASSQLTPPPQPTHQAMPSPTPTSQVITNTPRWPLRYR